MYSENLLKHTDFLAVLQELEFTCLDIGARGGFTKDLYPMAFAVDAIGFEPEIAECQRLNDLAAKSHHPWKSLKFLPVAISGTGGMRNLHITTHAGTASILQPNVHIGKQYNRPQYFSVDETRTVKTLTLDKALEAYDIDNPSFLKIDIEGAEFEVFRSAVNTLRYLLAIRTEVGFMDLRLNQPQFSDVDQLLREKGFRLARFIDTVYWRRTGSGNHHPHLAKGFIPYSQSEIAHSDALYLKTVDEINMNDSGEVKKLLGSAFIACSYGLFDFAGSILLREEVKKFLFEKYNINVERCLMSTSYLFYKDYLKKRIYSLPLQAKQIIKQIKYFMYDVWVSAHRR
ncbi:MAG: FkbM family methyltransferase [Deltaproteobacteria bacterium]|nr:MAG: FkbM family methyltransferase [Deltaproteobacteria bacterium]